MTSFGWLHLSDLHQGLEGQGWLWPNVREVFLEDLAKLHRLCGPWDIVLFTGDLTQRAGDQEFTRLTKTLDGIWEHLRDLGSDPILLAVPGNHDLVRPNPKNPAVRVMGNWNSDADVRNELWHDPGSPYRSVIADAFAHYTQWWNAHPLPRARSYRPGLLPGDFAATIEKNDVRLGVVGLNSAFLQLTGGDYEGKLALGLGQIQEACGGDVADWARAHDVCLLLTHHPPGWLGQAARQALHGEIAPPGRFAVHHFGHMHEGCTQTLSVGGAEPWRSWQAASLFGLESWADGRVERRHGYAAGRIKFEADAAYLRIWPRIGLQRKEGFWRLVPDLTSFDLEEDQGTRPEQLSLRRRPKAMPARGAPKKAAPEPVPSTAAARSARPPGAPVRVLMSHAAEDSTLAAELRLHLSPLRREGLIDLWDSSRVEAGLEVAAELERQLSDTDVVIVLLSSSYLSSAYDETERMLARSADGALRVIPIIARPCDWSESPLGSIQPLPRGGKPITKWSDRDEAWLDVARGLRGVLASFKQRRTAAGEAAPAEIISIGDIFRTTGQPDVTFVEPSQMTQLEIYLRIMGQGLVVEGPSGIGKTTATRKALEKARQQWPETYLTSKAREDVERLDAAVRTGFTGHLVVDDYHHLDDHRKRQLADLIKTMADKNRRDAKLTIIGINPVGDSLVAGFPDLVGRFVTVSMATQPREKLDELVRKGEAAAHVVFLRRSEFVEAAAGSFFTLQQLCFQAAMTQGIVETQPVKTEIKLGPRDVLNAVLDNLKFKYYRPLSAFASTDESSPPRGAVLALLWLLSEEKEGHVLLHDARLRYPTLALAFEWLGSHMQRCLEEIPQLSSLFCYQPGAGVLSVEDPQLKFYLAQMSWLDFARRTGHHGVRLDPRRGLVFGASENG
ncbi:TIR domain-containing protein [Sorangium sp. So ce295]|uniref:TIR domain-containing protein n=1 Tax=Sorangium sp. So ce295 TaxID=3133295 RepID=UPI003F63A491